MPMPAFNPGETRVMGAVAAGPSASTAQMMRVCPANSQPFLKGRHQGRIKLPGLRAVPAYSGWE